MKSILFIFLIFSPWAYSQIEPLPCPANTENWGYEREVSHHITQLIKTCDKAIEVGVACAKGVLSDAVITEAVESVCNTEIRHVYSTKEHFKALQKCQAECDIKISGDTPFADTVRFFCKMEQQRRYIFMRKRAILTTAPNLCPDTNLENYHD